jgi:shikimate kinase
VSPRPDRNLVLTGFMGTGKTTVGRRLAERLGLTFIDTDLVIEERHGPIADIFVTEGEEAFREMERAVAAELGAESGLVIATGGRMLLDEVNLDSLGRRGVVFCLVASPEEIQRRLDGEEDRPRRPLLDTADRQRRITELLAEREPGYARFTQVETDGKDLDEVVDELARLWEAMAEK